MLIRADPATGTISLLSFPRDLGVPIYCPKSAAALGAATAINAAYADCGPAGTLDTVKQLTELPVNYLITVNFHGFKEIVDKLGRRVDGRRPPLLQPQQRDGGRPTTRTSTSSRATSC